MCDIKSIILTVVMLVMCFSCQKNTTTADFIILNGNIVTLDDNNPRVEALAIKDNKILAAGTAVRINDLSGSETRILDAGGNLVIPGFIDGHAHFMSLGYSMMKLRLGKTQSWAEIARMVASAAAELPPGTWITGRGWHQEKWTNALENHVDGYPVHDLISRAAPDNPVYLTHASGHAIIANLAAMNLAQISSETPDPAGGTILHKTDGSLSGVFLENADTLIINRYSEYISNLTPDEQESRRQKAFQLANNECIKYGITSFHDAGVSFTEIDFYKKMIDTGKQKVRLWVMLQEENSRLQKSISHYKIIDYGNYHLTVRAIKRFMDGALGAHGAWLLSPYKDKPGSMGLNTIDLEEFVQSAEIAIAHGFQLCTHAIGDRGNRETLNTYESIFKKYPDKKDLRWRIEHAQHLHPDDIPRFAQLGIIASMQTVHCTSDGPWVIKKLGEERSVQGAYVWRSLIQSGAIISNGTDAPVESVNPFENYYAAITRKMADGKTFYPGQKMTRDEALRSYTIKPAYAGFEEHIKGSLTPGKLADITILSKDILTVPEEEILSTEVIFTIIGGKIVYRSENLPD